MMTLQVGSMATSTELQNRRRLSAAAFKLNQFVEHLDQWLADGFPHDDGIWALDEIRKLTIEKQKRLLRANSNLGSETVALSYDSVKRFVFKHTKTLGIISGSKNVKNNFEIYFPLKRLACELLGDETRLLLSSDWEFIPFTWSIGTRNLPNLILVGSPATEAPNLLSIPLSGHEIGHSIFLKEKLREFFRDQAKSILAKVDPEETEVDENSILAKIEEIFCDLFGLWIFRDAYLLSFEYFLAPGLGDATQSHPTDIARLEIMKRACDRTDFPIHVTSGVVDDWVPINNKESIDQRVDNELIQSSDLIFEYLNEYLQGKEIGVPNPQKVSEIGQCFRRNEPYDGEPMLSEVVIAFWNEAKLLDLRKKEDYRLFNALNDMAIKCVEVSEFRRRILLDKMRKR